MVATRRGTRVGSPVKNTSDENSRATPTPSTRRTRRRTLMEENQSQSELADDSQPDEPKDDRTASSSIASPLKRETRRSTRLLADKKEPNSTNEADVSESESCCSVVSEVQVTPRTRRRTAVREKPTVQDEASEVESCSSEVSATRSRRAPRSLRKRVLTSAATKDAAKNDDDDPSGDESCSSAVSFTTAMDTRRITRSHRKTAVPSAEADSSGPESCSSSVSGLHGSVVRRSARNQKVKPTQPIPLSFEETTDTPSSPVSKKRGHRNKVDEENESDGCKSGPSTSPLRSTRRQTKPSESDSELVANDVCHNQGSPSLQRGRGTPCSSRTGSSSSTCAVPVTRARSKAKLNSDVGDTVTTVAAMPEELGEEHEPHPESFPVHDGDKAEDTIEQLDRTVTMDTSEAQESIMIEESAEDTTLVLDQDEAIEMQGPQSFSQDVEAVEDSGTEILTLQEKPVDETSSAVIEEPEDVAMGSDELVEMSQVVPNQTCTESVNEDLVDTTVEYPVSTVVEEHENKIECEKKGVIVYEEANDTTKTTGNYSVILNDLEGSSTSSHTEPNLITTEEISKKLPPQEKRISLLDSSEDEDSADEGLSSEEEGCSQKVEDDVMHPDGNQASEKPEAHGDGLFVIDTKPGLRSEKQYYVDAKQTEEEYEEDFVDEEDEDDDEDSTVLFTSKKPLIQLSSAIDTGLKMKELGGLYISFNGNNPKSLSNSSKTQNNPDELLKKSVIVPDFEKKDSVPPYSESKHATKLKRKAEREKTTGDGWFNMRAPELTEELKNDLKALKMRSAMDPKRFYKKNDREGPPKYFQVGTVVDNPVDFYSSRIPKKQRKRTMVEELLADAEFRSYNKKKYQEIMAEKAAQAAGKMNKKHKFHKKKINL
ncbi:deoxynucleotidyltransferase terminal-interacting protein 2-like isoform X2 [Carassius auratus]|uniref:Deoxynucleotidyltransferase terminal-interacting protein 2-like isoform X2 n=1 Tax=Carassius auratus TaxID=7957 RepID=A0A6P6PYP0_CARAU|nr:deoxynucleotidyltransferase terminal-interacting protein 2-like isoform X2 [Carassius auratus]